MTFSLDIPTAIARCFADSADGVTRDRRFPYGTLGPESGTFFGR